jgi:hypothetical protein
VRQLVTDGETDGFGVNIRKGNFGPDRTFHQLDLRLQKAFSLFRGGEFQVWAEVFNVFNTDNLGFSGTCCGPSAFGPPTVLIGPPRSVQFGTAFRF